MRPKTLYGKLSIALAALLIFATGISLFSTGLATRWYIREVGQRLNQDLAANLVKEKIFFSQGRVNEEVLGEVFHTLMVINPGIEVYLLDPTGVILGYSAPPEKIRRRAVSMEPVRRFIAGTSRLPITGEDPRDPDREKVFSASPIPSSGPVEGYLYIILGGEDYDSVAQLLTGSYILRLGTGAAVAGLIFALLAGAVLFRLLTRRLRFLSREMETFRNGDFTLPPPTPDPPPPLRPDEIDRLRTAFLQMRRRITDQMNELKQTDAFRREWVANVSHDLRTPLASLQGYLETLLLKEGVLPLSEQRRYLEIAAAQSERLGRRIAELFELAKLDSSETRPHLERFSLAELTQDVVQKFRLSAEKKGIRLLTDFPEDLPFISADIGLIERVFENLIENGLRHTPEGGTIQVVLRLEGDRIGVRVADTGSGIPPDEIPHIFQRFYRARNTGGTHGAGLGLAIAKRILDLHESSIRVESDPDRGAVFSFELPVAKT